MLQVTGGATGSISNPASLVSKTESLHAAAAALQIDEAVRPQLGQRRARDGLHDARFVPISNDQPRAGLEKRKPSPDLSGISRESARAKSSCRC